MAESSGEKTEEATPQKLLQARRKGQVAQSKDLATAAVLLSGFALMSFQALGIAMGYASRTARTFSLAGSSELNRNLLLTALFGEIEAAMVDLMPLLVLLTLVAGFAMFLQTGPIFASEKLKPKIENLNPIEGFKNKFFKARTYVELVKTLIKLSVIAGLAWVIVRSHQTEILRLSRVPPLSAATQAVAIIAELLAWILVTFLAIGVIDFFYQRFQFLKDQRMSKDEVKREYKEQEGDPEQKFRLMQSRMERMQSAMYGNLMAGGADAVIVNPTHIACALRFDPKKESVPRLVAKGKGVVAKRIREICEDKAVPVKRDIELARTLHGLKLWDQIPEELYEAIQEVLLWVSEEAERRGEVAAWRERLDAHEAAQE